jgi:hypothetical protein
MIINNKSGCTSAFPTLTLSWILLLSLTLAAAILSQQDIASHSLILLALSITVFKSQIVVDIFMGLKNAERGWRILMLSYVVIIPFIMMLTYLSA